jgi:Holliday junction resolvase RusA-like endonuclease
MIRIKIKAKALSINQAYRRKRYRTKKYDTYESEVIYLISSQFVGIPKIPGYVDIIYRFYVKNWKRVDVDNLIKPLQDTLVKAGVIDDDRKVMSLVVDKIPAEKNFIDIFIKKTNRRLVICQLPK